MFWRGMAPTLAVDGRGPTHRGRIYALWNDFGDNGERLPRMLLSYSDDRGATWVEPRPVAPAAGSAQFRGNVAVNADGVVGVVWMDTRDHPGRDGFHAYFTASLDGGDSFLPPVALSRAASDPFSPGNRRQVPFYVGSYRGHLLVSMGSAASRWEDGGDYLGLAADQDGVFHPLWSDGRGTAYQSYTARVRVIPDRDVAVRRDRDHRGEPVDVSDAVGLLVDPPAFDSARGVATFPVRLRNESSDTLYPPLRVRARLMNDRSGPIGGAAVDSVESVILDGDGGTATFDYDVALGDWSALPPGCATEAVAWRVRLGPVDAALSFEVKVTAGRENARKDAGDGADEATDEASAEATTGRDPSHVCRG